MPGGEEFLRLSRDLKAVSAGLRLDLADGLNRAARPLIAQTRVAALAQLPKRGGLNQRYANNPQRVRVRTGPLTAGVQIVMPKAGPRSIEQGQIRHPVFGRAGRWVPQQVSGTWWDETLEAGAPTVRRELDQVAETIRRRLTGE